MEPQTITIEVAPLVAEILRRLEARAKAQGVTLDSLLLPLVPENGIASANEELDAFMADMESMAEGTEHLPSLPATYSRSDIYLDHD